MAELSLFFMGKIVLLWIIFALYKLYKQRRWFKGLPQPPSSFIWGHLQIMGEIAALFPPNTHYQILLTAISQKYNLPPIWYLDLWPLADSFVVVTDPDLVNQTTVLPKHELVDNFLNAMVGRNTIVAVNGSLWKKLHSIIQPAFTWSFIRNLTSIIEEETGHFCRTLDGFAESGEVFSMANLTTNLVYDITGKIVFDQALHAQTGGSLTAQDINEIPRLSEASMTWNPLKSMFIKYRRRLVVRRVDDLIKTKIAKRWALLKDQKEVFSKSQCSNIMDMMLREQMLQRDSEPFQADLRMDESQILVNNLKVLMIGGHGTTADLLSFVFLLLSKYPDVIEKLREEHVRVFSEDPSETSTILAAHPSKINDLPYTSAILFEAMRLFPAGISARRCANVPTFTYRGREYPISNGLAVVPNIHTVHYDESYFLNAKEFYPDRYFSTFSQSKIKADSVSPWSLAMPFGGGKRACIGQDLAEVELKIPLLLTLRSYDFECAEVPNKECRTSYTKLDTLFGNVIFQQFGISAKPGGDVLMRVKKRTA